MKPVKLFLLVSPLLSLFLSGCQGKTASQVAFFPDQSKLLTVPNLCRIYVFRDSSSYFSAWQSEIFDGETYIGTIEPYTYLCWEKEPKHTEITVKGHQHAAYAFVTGEGFLAAISSPVLSFDPEEGKIYYIRYSQSFGKRIKLLDEDKGKKRLQKCKPPTYKVTSKGTFQGKEND
jgi:hypothetical protein